MDAKLEKYLDDIYETLEDILEFLKKDKGEKHSYRKHYPYIKPTYVPLTKEEVDELERNHRRSHRKPLVDDQEDD